MARVATSAAPARPAITRAPSTQRARPRARSTCAPRTSTEAVDGTKVDTEYDGGPNFPVTITGSVNFSGQNTAAVLNSTTGPAGQDPDLLVGKGNILILQTDANLTECLPGSGVYCSHNDDEDGGTLSFAFSVSARPSSIVLIDIDSTDPTSTVVLTDSTGKTRTYTVPADWTGDLVTNGPPGFRTLFLDTTANQPGFASTATANEQAGALRDQGALETTTVLVVGDHGEALGDHDEPTHGLYCYESTMRVPMILRRSDGRGAGTRDRGIASVADVHPTLMEAMGLSPSRDLDGISLFASGAPPGRGAYLESYYGYFSYGWSPITGWVEAAGKYLHSSDPEYYDVGGDATEARNLLDERAGEIERFREAIRSVAARPALPRDARATDPHLLESIQALGYAESHGDGADLPGLLDEARLPSPRRRAEEDRTFRDAETRILEGRELPEAESSLRAILAANPRHYLARDVLGTCLILQGHFAEALEVLQEAVQLGSPVANTHVNMAIALIRLERGEEALVCLQRALEIDPGHLKALGNLVFVLEKLGRRDEAVPFRRRFEELAGRPLPGGG